MYTEEEFSHVIHVAEEFLGVEIVVPYQRRVLLGEKAVSPDRCFIFQVGEERIIELLSPEQKAEGAAVVADFIRTIGGPEEQVGEIKTQVLTDIMAHKGRVMVGVILPQPQEGQEEKIIARPLCWTIG
ncbi:hypothetical protein A2160_05835 [Candidatus Beckwithbacteria bacterium RBG_13_42_9]|uniref:Uncharacterized protein n=1 Tax=Candidatus Beckwithbacteria bacterium RBG_13_42_9 TaxID=1797457 RepID=A0A1F5E562_9BACT|nr:MAG: hypothetical protein A2160_05835 [Candidatus Beckwithbacteria bacterium RBG_13_42_9]